MIEPTHPSQADGNPYVEMFCDALLGAVNLEGGLAFPEQLERY
jgi:hypothetical protein